LKNVPNEERDGNKVVITKVGLWLYGVMVIILFYFLSQPTIAPDSMVSAIVNSLGEKTIVIIIALPVILLEIILRKKGVRTYYINKT